MNLIERSSSDFKSAMQRQRLVEPALSLCSIYSPTRSAGEVSDCLAGMLASEGFVVERPTGGWDAAPAVAVRFSSGRPGKTLQFDGHLDTVHLPFERRRPTASKSPAAAPPI